MYIVYLLLSKGTVYSGWPSDGTAYNWVQLATHKLIKISLAVREFIDIHIHRGIQRRLESIQVLITYTCVVVSYKNMIYVTLVLQE